MSTPDEQCGAITGTVEWFDAERGVGVIRPDNGTPPCGIRSDALHACGIASVVPGDRLRFRIREEDGRRDATDLTLIQAIDRWENEGGATRSGPPPA